MIVQSKNPEPFGRRRWRLVIIQLLKKLGYCPSWTISVVLVLNKCNSLLLGPIRAFISCVEIVVIVSGGHVLSFITIHKLIFRLRFISVSKGQFTRAFSREPLCNLTTKTFENDCVNRAASKVALGNRPCQWQRLSSANIEGAFLTAFAKEIKLWSLSVWPD